MTKQPTRPKRGGQLPLFLMLVPGTLYMLVNNYVPMMGLFIAFKNINYQLGVFASPWYGLNNFKFLFSTGDAWLITRNTLLYNLAFILFGMVFGVAMAIFLNEIISSLLKKVFQTILLLPQIVSMVIVAYLVYALLSGDNGFINNSILAPMGIEPINWYNEKQYWPFILIFTQVWKTIGYNTLLYLASIVGIDGALYEAAEMDGCSRLQQIRHITLPLLKPTVITLSLLMVGRIFYSDFGLFYQVPMDSGALYNVTNTIDTYVYRGLMTLGNIGMSAAASFYQSIVGFVVVLSANALVRRIDRENALL